MAYRVANSILGLFTAVNAIAPERSKASDGTIGDAAHRARKSDHNPNQYGVVTAGDFTHDPAKGADMGKITESLRKSRDNRIKYVIYNSRMFSSYTSYNTDGSVRRKAWEWGPYGGSNPHIKHSHVSVSGSPSVYDQTDRWIISAPTSTPISTPGDDNMLPLKLNDGMTAATRYKRSDVSACQGMINKAFGTALTTDGMYGPATAAAVLKYLKRDNLDGNGYDDLIWAVGIAAAKSLGFGNTDTAIDQKIKQHAGNPDAHHA